MLIESECDFNLLLFFNLFQITITHLNELISKVRQDLLPQLESSDEKELIEKHLGTTFEILRHRRDNQASESPSYQGISLE